jgi:hypothetical protein
MTVELAATTAMSLVAALIHQLNAMAEVDEVSKRLKAIVKNLEYALEGARERGSFRSSHGSTKAHLESVNTKLRQLQEWITNYQNAGRGGMLRRMKEYFFACSNLEELRRLSQELDDACKGLNLSLNLEICAGVKELLQQQSNIAKDVVDIIEQRGGRADDHELAEIIARKTNMTIENVRRELARDMEFLRRDVGEMKVTMGLILALLQAHLDGSALPAPPLHYPPCYQNHDSYEDVATSLELAPFSRSEWEQERHSA